MPSLIHFCMELFKVICISSDLPTDATAARVIKNFASLYAPMILSFSNKKKSPWSWSLVSIQVSSCFPWYEEIWTLKVKLYQSGSSPFDCGTWSPEMGLEAWTISDLHDLTKSLNFKIT